LHCEAAIRIARADGWNITNVSAPLRATRLIIPGPVPGFDPIALQTGRFCHTELSTLTQLKRMSGVRTFEAAAAFCSRLFKSPW